MEKNQVFQNRKCYEITLPISSFLDKTENTRFPSPLGMGVACADLLTERALFIRRPTRMAPLPRTQVSTALPSQWGCPPSGDALPVGMPSQWGCLANREGRLPGAPPPPLLQREPSLGPRPPRLSLLMGETRKMKVYDASLIKTVPQVLHPLPNTPSKWPPLPLPPPHPLTWPFM